MRTFILILLMLLLLATQALAQIGKGKIISETSLNLLLEKIGENRIPEMEAGGGFSTSGPLPRRKKEITFNISESIGYSISDRLVAGIGVGYSSHTIKYEGPTYLTIAGSFDDLTIANSGPLILLDPKVDGVINITDSDIEELRTISVKPSLYLSYFISLSDKLHLVPRFDFQYEKTTTTHAYVTTSRDLLYELNSPETTKYLNYAFSTAVFFKISECFGVQAKIFNARFHDNIEDSKISGVKDNFDITISPLNWEYGVVFMIGTKQNKNEE